MIEKWKEIVDSSGAFGALTTDLSKGFDCLHHELLIAKVDAYGFDTKSVKLIQQYLLNRKQSVKRGNAYSSSKEIFYGIPQGSIIGPLIFQHLSVWLILLSVSGVLPMKSLKLSFLVYTTLLLGFKAVFRFKAISYFLEWSFSMFQYAVISYFLGKMSPKLVTE